MHLNVLNRSSNLLVKGCDKGPQFPFDFTSLMPNDAYICKKTVADVLLIGDKSQCNLGPIIHRF